MRLKNNIDYKRFPEPYRGDWDRFTILVLSANILAKTPSECTQRGFFLFLGPKKMHQKCTREMILPTIGQLQRLVIQLVGFIII